MFKLYVVLIENRLKNINYYNTTSLVKSLTIYIVKKEA